MHTCITVARHSAHVRSAEAGICKVAKWITGVTADLAISLQFRRDHFQDICICMPCVYICYAISMTYIYAWHPFREFPNPKFLWCFFQRTFSDPSTNRLPCWVDIFTVCKIYTWTRGFSKIIESPGRCTALQQGHDVAIVVAGVVARKKLRNTTRIRIFKKEVKPQQIETTKI